LLPVTAAIQLVGLTQADPRTFLIETNDHHHTSKGRFLRILFLYQYAADWDFTDACRDLGLSPYLTIRLAIVKGEGKLCPVFHAV